MVAQVLVFDLGEARSIRAADGSNSVADIILERLPRTVMLLTTALIINAVIGLTVGVWLSTRPGSRADRFVSYVAAITNGLPAWWAGILLILIFSFWLRILPSGGMYSTPPPEGAIASFLDLAWHALLPIFTLVLVVALAVGWQFLVLDRGRTLSGATSGARARFFEARKAGGKAALPTGD